MKIGIPRALLTYEYPILYTKFFELLGIEVILSDETNNKILEDGVKLSVDEACLASKIFLGHVMNLIEKSKKEKLDYIFIPRVGFFDKKETVCVKFYALIDICKNIFDFNFLTLNVDYKTGDNELKAFMKLGKKLKKSELEIIKAYVIAKRLQKMNDLKKYTTQIKSIENSKNKKILIVSHPYIEHDNILGKHVINYLRKNNINVYYANINSSKVLKNKLNKYRYKEISKSIYWKYNKELLNGIVEYKDKVDGIIYLSVFPCGTDSLTTDISIRKINDIPTLNIILDEQQANAGVITRLESFIDIIEGESQVIVNE